MPVITPIADGESGLSVRAKLNSAFLGLNDIDNLQGFPILDVVPNNGQILQYSTPNGRYEPSTLVGLTTGAQSFSGEKTFTTSPIVPDVTPLTSKDDKAANTQFVQESLERSGWRLVQVDITNGSTNQFDFIVGNYTALDVDQIKYRISNLRYGATTSGRFGQIRINDLTTTGAANSWQNSGFATSSTANSIGYAEFTALNTNAFIYNSSTEVIMADVEGRIQTFGTDRMLVELSENRIVYGSGGNTFQKANWSCWSSAGIYPTNKITGIRVMHMTNTGGVIGAQQNWTSGVKFEWFIKTKN